MKKSIFLKLISGYFFIIILLSSLILLFSFNTIRNYYIDTLTANLRNLCLTLKPKAISFLQNNRFQELDDFIKDLGENIDTRVTIIDPNGVVLADSEKEPELMENHKNRPEIMGALEGDIGKSLRFSSTVKEEMLYVAIPMKKDEKIIGVLRTSLFLKDINNLLGNLKSKIFNIAFIVIIISLLIAIIFSKRLSKPIKELANASRRVASGDFNVRVFLENKDELKELADSFNYMTEKIKNLFTDLSIQKEELNIIISSIQEGFLALDKEGKIIIINESLKKIIDTDYTENKYYWEILREPKLSDLIKKVTQEQKNFVEEIGLNEKDFLCSATFIPFKKEVVLILHDITEMKKLEKVKKDFVANVSHELRTPLTAIKGYTETLEEENDDKKRRHYLNIIYRNTENLINIVRDLLLLSEFEEKKFELNFEEVYLKNILKDIIKIFSQKLKEKGLSLKLNIGENIPNIKADPFKLEQMFINLIDNAIKYTEEGKIIISLVCQDKFVKIKIEDTGIGIPKEHLERIFERFYVVDKSRSKRLGGTGLGLSIAKHIALLHNGKIDVESTINSGTKFTITLPFNHS